MDIKTYLGLFAAACTSLSFFPQVIKVIKSKSTKDISLAMFLIFCVGVAAWLVYGILLRDTPIILANIITLILAGIILGYKIRYR